MKNKKNTFAKVLVCAFVVYELIQINNYKTEREKLGVLKQNVSDLQTSLKQKENEVNNLTRKIEADKNLENEKKLMEEEIKKLEKTASELNKYMASSEQNLSNLSQSIIDEKASTTIKALKNKNFKDLVSIVHPTKGVRLSHTSEIQVNSEIIIKKEQLLSLSKDNKKYNWGIINGQGQSVMLSFNEYYNNYIYDQDYFNSTERTFNKFVQRPNQTNNNIYDIYNSGIIVEYFHKGSKENNYTDWSSLYLAFENYENTWYLVAIIHS